MSKIRIEHVKPEFTRLRPVSLSRHELEPGIGIDEAPNQPRGSDTIDVNAFARDPDASRVRTSFCLSLMNRCLSNFCLELTHSRLSLLACAGRKEIDRLNFVQS